MKSLMDYIGEAKQEIKEVSLEEGRDLVEKGVKILDVREPGEYLSGAISGAINVPRGILEPAADFNYPGANPELRDGRDEEWLIVCRSGGRAALATKTLKEMGFNNVSNLLGGMDAWQSQGFPMVAPSDENMTITLKEPCRID
ncbi:rhodanese-like domain-containing protein [Thiomicrorhabdus sp. ZW0627]|uniref:rhodanese-like domain-containing protein n=1 Tax=Thiomicrorhabdus sp. ZW0627 TaxID=3039774 RepID=UPI002436AD62|nr:rhodanese-like domain-containing protein [Thiomicrorhabdus sp. ZW0627]MDG6774446.1 rhodanese-like domain-containing protein [Thiomicrorhabdus sp. ZW0627]